MSTNTKFTARQLVDSSEWLPGTMAVEELVDWFKTHTETEYAAVVADGTIAGMVSRESLNSALSFNQYAFAVLSKKPITRVMHEHVLFVKADTSITEVVNLLLRERGDTSKDFYQDVIVHDGEKFVGLASVKKLVVTQMQFILQQMGELEHQKDMLAERNRELFETTANLQAGTAELSSFFESCSLPIIIFDNKRTLQRGNPEFLRISGYSREDVDTNPPAEALFEGGMQPIIEAYNAAKESFGERKPSFSSTLIRKDGSRKGYELSVDISESDGQIVLSLIRGLTESQLEIDRLMNEMISNETIFVRQVVGSLVDRDMDIEAAPARLEALVAYARELEASKTSSGQDEGKMSGALGEFSVIDLCQLLVQGGKTGELTLTSSNQHTSVAYFVAGNITHALHAEDSGIQALRSMVQERDGTFLFSFDVSAPERSIEGEGMNVLMDACRLSDEESGHEVHSPEDPVFG